MEKKSLKLCKKLEIKLILDDDIPLERGKVIKSYNNWVELMRG
jgi:hypothetical protein